MPPRILVIESDVMMQESLRLSLECEGIVSAFVSEQRAAVERAAAEAYNLVLVDADGLRASVRACCADVRRRAGSRPIPILLLTSRAHETIAIDLLEDGVDAYLLKPFDTRELIARVRALLRRTAPTTSGSLQPGGAALVLATAPLQIRDLDIDLSRRRVRLDGLVLKLTEQEFQLLYFLANRPGRVFDRRSLLDALWGDEANVTLRSVDALVKRLRRRLRAGPDGVSYVQTVRGVGYRFIETHDTSLCPPPHSASRAR